MKENIFILKPLSFGWLLVVSMVVVLAFRQGLTFDSSILTLLPKSDQQPLIQIASDQMSKDFSGRLIMLISGKNDQDVRAAVGTMAEKLALLPGISGVNWQVKDNEITTLREELYPYRFSVLDRDIRKLLLGGIHPSLS